MLAHPSGSASPNLPSEAELLRRSEYCKHLWGKDFHVVDPLGILQRPPGRVASCTIKPFNAEAPRARIVSFCDGHNPMRTQEGIQWPLRRHIRFTRQLKCPELAHIASRGLASAELSLREPALPRGTLSAAARPCWLLPIHFLGGRKAEAEGVVAVVGEVVAPIARRAVPGAVVPAAAPAHAVRVAGPI